MQFLIQSDDVCVIEKRVIRHASNLIDSKLHFASLNSLTLGSIRQDVPAQAVPVGTVEFVTAVMFAREIAEPIHISYPKCLRSQRFLKRAIRQGEFSDAAGNVFVKPRYDVKRFTGALLPELISHPNTFTLADDYPVWISEPVKFVSEWRYYILRDQIIGAGRYDDGDDGAPIPDINLIHSAVAAMELNFSPAGYALDFGVLDNGETALVEVNDGWALGYYKGEQHPRIEFEGACSSVDYARLLHARWIQLLSPNIHKNTFHK